MSNAASSSYTSTRKALNRLQAEPKRAAVVPRSLQPDTALRRAPAPHWHAAHASSAGPAHQASEFCCSSDTGVSTSPQHAVVQASQCAAAGELAAAQVAVQRALQLATQRTSGGGVSGQLQQATVAMQHMLQAVSACASMPSMGAAGSTTIDISLLFTASIAPLLVAGWLTPADTAAILGQAAAVQAQDFCFLIKAVNKVAGDASDISSWCLEATQPQAALVFALWLLLSAADSASTSATSPAGTQAAPLPSGRAAALASQLLQRLGVSISPQAQEELLGSDSTADAVQACFTNSSTAGGTPPATPWQAGEELVAMRDCANICPAAPAAWSAASLGRWAGSRSVPRVFSIQVQAMGQAEEVMTMLGDHELEDDLEDPQSFEPEVIEAAAHHGANGVNGRRQVTDSEGALNGQGLNGAGGRLSVNGQELSGVRVTPKRPDPSLPASNFSPQGRAGLRTRPARRQPGRQDSGSGSDERSSALWGSTGPMDNFDFAQDGSDEAAKHPGHDRPRPQPVRLAIKNTAMSNGVSPSRLDLPVVGPWFISNNRIAYPGSDVVVPLRVPLDMWQPDSVQYSYWQRLWAGAKLALRFEYIADRASPGTEPVLHVFNISRVRRGREKNSRAYVNGVELYPGGRGMPLSPGDEVVLGVAALQRGDPDGGALRLVVEPVRAQDVESPVEKALRWYNCRNAEAATAKPSIATSQDVAATMVKLKADVARDPTNTSAWLGLAQLTSTRTDGNFTPTRDFFRAALHSVDDFAAAQLRQQQQQQQLEAAAEDAAATAAQQGPSGAAGPGRLSADNLPKPLPPPPPPSRSTSSEDHAPSTATDGGRPASTGPRPLPMGLGPKSMQDGVKAPSRSAGPSLPAGSVAAMGPASTLPPPVLPPTLPLPSTTAPASTPSGGGSAAAWPLERKRIQVLFHWAAAEWAAGNQGSARHLWRRAADLTYRHPTRQASTGSHWRVMHAWASAELAKDGIKNARIVLAEALRRSPTAQPLYVLGGSIELAAGNLDLAKGFFAEAYKMNRTDEKLYEVWPKVEAALGERDKARVLFERGLEYHPGSLKLLQAYAEFEAEHGDAQVARELNKKALSLDPEGLRTLTIRANLAALELDADRLPVARRLIIEGRALGPWAAAHPDLLLVQARLERLSGNLEAARRLLQSVDRAHGFYRTDITKERVQLLRALGEQDQARALDAHLRGVLRLREAKRQGVNGWEAWRSYFADAGSAERKELKKKALARKLQLGLWQDGWADAAAGTATDPGKDTALRQNSAQNAGQWQTTEEAQHTDQKQRQGGEVTPPRSTSMREEQEGEEEEQWALEQDMADLAVAMRGKVQQPGCKDDDEQGVEDALAAAVAAVSPVPHPAFKPKTPETYREQERRLREQIWRERRERLQQRQQEREEAIAAELAQAQARAEVQAAWEEAQRRELEEGVAGLWAEQRQRTDPGEAWEPETDVEVGQLRPQQQQPAQRQECAPQQAVTGQGHVQPEQPRQHREWHNAHAGAEQAASSGNGHKIEQEEESVALSKEPALRRRRA